MNGISNVVATQGCRDYATVRRRSRMPTRRWLLLPCVLIGIVAVTGGPRAQGPVAAFHAVGQLPGLRAQPASIIRDATRVGNVIYAVGGAAERLCSPTSGLCGETDTAVLWRFDGRTRRRSRPCRLSLPAWPTQRPQRRCLRTPSHLAPPSLAARHEPTPPTDAWP